jgi:hypothetical protein
MRIGRRLAILAAVFVLSASADLPPVRVVFPRVPPVPSTGWPEPQVAEPFARELIEDLPPQLFDLAAHSNPELVPAVLRNLATALLSHDAQLQTSMKRYATALVRAHAARMPRDFSEDDLHMLVAFQVLDPLRYGEDDAYRRAVDTILPDSLSPLLPEPLRRADVNELNRVAPINFETAEALAVSAGLVRASSSRFIANSTVTISTAGNEPIEASIYSINSRFVKPDEAKRFLTAVRAATPRRRIVVIGDEAMKNVLKNELASIDFVNNFNRPLTPWPRDPFSVARAANGGVVFINRPNQQHNREEDASMVRVLLNGLPKPLDDRWKPRWTTGATSFHNGQILLTPKAIWISMHSVEFRALELLGIDHVPVERFGSAAGIGTYTDAVQRAANELSKLYNRPVRFVHELPHTPQQIATLGGGAGFDLDSIVTLLPHGDGSVDALVGDVSLGTKLAASANDWQQLEKTYSLTANARDAVIKFQSDPSSIGLQRFLDRCANDLSARGMKVRRLPLLMVPTSLLMNDDDRPETPYFLVTANNVVLEGNRAEGFASGLRLVDSAARATFKSAGYELTLLPVLPRSVVLNGGYRCASNEVRRSK